MSNNETNEKNENLTLKDVVVLSAAATATIMAVGGLARLGHDLAGEGLRNFKVRRAVKKAEEGSPK
jgi:hypothetical protein